MLKVGKLDNDTLRAIVLDKIKVRRDDVIIRPGIGEDCAVLDYGEYECVMSTDPITAAIEKIGSLAVHISCNDIASNGVEPIGLLLTVLLPEGTEKEDVETMMQQASDAAEELNVEIIGGHTEVTTVVNQPVIVSTAVGKAIKGQSQNTKNMKPGDHILITKHAGLEGTGILATDKRDELASVLTDSEMAEAQAMLDQVSVVKEGLIAGKIGTSGMHDITEGGVLGAIWEMCEIAKLGAEIIEEDIPVAQVTRKICKHFDIDPLRFISSGSMMIVATPEKSAEIQETLNSAGVKTTQIGKIADRADGLIITTTEGRVEIDPPGSDEIYRV